MGAAALVGDCGHTGACLHLAAGSLVGAACASAHQECGNRVCVVDAPWAASLSASPLQCASCVCGVLESTRNFVLSGVVHEVVVAEGVVGTLTSNEPVVGVRARTLPYAQTIGRVAGSSHWWPRGVRLTDIWSAGSVRSLASSLGDSIGGPKTHDSAPAFVPGGAECAADDADTREERFVFGDWPFCLPDMTLQDDVVIAFGTRTVFRLRLPLFGASSAPLDFEILGVVRMPVRKLLQSSQPVHVSVPIKPQGNEVDPQVARASLTFHVTSNFGDARAVSHHPGDPAGDPVTLCIVADAEGAHGDCKRDRGFNARSVERLPLVAGTVPVLKEPAAASWTEPGSHRFSGSRGVQSEIQNLEAQLAALKRVPLSGGSPLHDGNIEGPGHGARPYHRV